MVKRVSHSQSLVWVETTSAFIFEAPCTRVRFALCDIYQLGSLLIEGEILIQMCCHPQRKSCQKVNLESWKKQEKMKSAIITIMKWILQNLKDMIKHRNTEGINHKDAANEETRLSLKCSAWKSFIPCLKSLFPKEDPTFQILVSWYAWKL